MYIYHALINTLSAHMIHVNLNMILSIVYTHTHRAQSYHNNLHKVVYEKTKHTHALHYTHALHTHTHYTHTHKSLMCLTGLIHLQQPLMW